MDNISFRTTTYGAVCYMIFPHDPEMARLRGKGDTKV